MAAANEAIAWCESEGLVRPRLMMSGNGAQLWFALPATALEGERRERLQAGLKAFETKVRERAQTDAVHVDSIHDVARIIKVIGTVSHKGDGKGDRPHRVSAALSGFDRAAKTAALARVSTSSPSRRCPSPPRASRSPIVGNVAAPGTIKAKRTPEGEYDWEHRSRCAAPSSGSGTTAPRTAASPSSTWCASSRTRASGSTRSPSWSSSTTAGGMGKLRGRDGVRHVAKAHEKVLSPPRAPTAPSRRRATRSRRSASAR